MNTIKLTPNEFKVLAAIDASEYGDTLGSAVWTFTIQDHCDLTPRSIPGVVASLSKKGLVRIAGTGREAEIGMSEQGQAVYLATLQRQGLTTNKEVEHAAATTDELSNCTCGWPS